MNTNDILYIRVSNRIAKTGGGLSQSVLARKLSIARENEVVFLMAGFKAVLFSLLKSFFKKSDLNLYICSIYTESGIKGKVKQYLNKLIFKQFIKKSLKLNASKWIFDCYLPDLVSELSKLDPKLRGEIMCIARSSPHCFSWVTQPDRLCNFSRQLSQSDVIICASRDVADMWLELVMKPIPIISLPTPFLGSSNSTTPIDNFLTDKTLNIILLVGSVGPRKGVNLVLEAIGDLASRIDKPMTLHIFGSITGWKPQSITMLESLVRVEVHGFQNLDLTLRPKKECIFLFGSYSECFSRAQMEVIALGCPVLINRYGLDSRLMKNLQRGSIFSNRNELADRLAKTVIADKLADLLPLDSEAFYNDLNRDFTNGIQEIYNYHR